MNKAQQVYNMLNDIYPQGCTLAVHNSHYGKTPETFAGLYINQPMRLIVLNWHLGKPIPERYQCK